MIALDSSAALAVILGEADAESYARVIERHDCLVGCPTALEIYIAARRKPHPTAGRAADDLLSAPNIRLVPVDEVTYRAARAAFDQFGLGRRRRPAVLNFGDCLAYAVARVHRVPLLYKGDDFAQTDIRPAR